MKDESILETAADWLLRLEESDCTDSERQSFERWYGRDARHRQAVDQMRGLIGQLQGLQSEGKAASSAISNTLARRQRHTPRTLMGLGAAMVSLSALMLLSGDWRQNLQADLYTAPGEWRREQLADDSVLLLAGNSAVKLHYDNGQRSVELLRGEVLVDVAPDPLRPFRVTTEDGSMRALGTRFVVNLEADDTLLSMLHSRVSAQSADGSQTREISAGEQARITFDSIQLSGTVDPNGFDQSWQRRQLVVRDAPLGEVLQQLSRQQRGYWNYSDPALNQMRISAVLPLDDSARALALIEDILPIEVQRYTPWLVRIKAMQDQE